MSDDKLTFEEARLALDLAAQCDDHADRGLDLPLSYTDLKLAARALRTLVLALPWPDSAAIPARRAQG